MTTPGRSCPTAYRYRMEELAGRAPLLTADTVHVVGCLYGNVHALRAVVAAAEADGAALLFNGDFHWLDVDDAAFAEVAGTVAAHAATLGNVEAELVSTAPGEAGCGCAYPAYTPDHVVELSNAIAGRLRHTAARVGDKGLDHLRGLGRRAVVAVDGHRVGVLHGDGESLAGWRLALEALEPGDAAVRTRTGFDGEGTPPAVVASWLDAAEVDLLAVTHTGLPSLHPVGDRLVVNNGRAGMGNLAGDRAGLVTRISRHPQVPAGSAYGTTVAGLRVDAVRIPFDADAWERDFLAAWPPGSPGHDAYAELVRAGGWLPVEAADRVSAAAVASSAG